MGQWKGDKELITLALLSEAVVYHTILVSVD